VRQRVHQRIIRIARFEDHLATDGGNTEAIAIMRDAAHHSVKDSTILRGGAVAGDRAEAQRIKHRNRARAHGENIAENSADAGGRALKRFHEAGMIVRFDLEDGDQAVANIDYAGVFARALHHVLAVRRQTAQMDSRGLVGAVLAPADAENSELGEIRIAAQDLLYACVFVRRKTMLGGELRRYLDVCVDCGH